MVANGEDADDSTTGLIRHDIIKRWLFDKQLKLHSLYENLEGRQSDVVEKAKALIS